MPGSIDLEWSRSEYHSCAEICILLFRCTRLHDAVQYFDVRHDMSPKDFHNALVIECELDLDRTIGAHDFRS